MLTSWSKWAFGIQSWRFVTFPTAMGIGVVLATTSPYALIRVVGAIMAAGYAVCFALVLLGRLRLPER